MPKHATQSPHWSVDFVEHLRTVHFALASVSAVLIMVVAGAQDLPVSRALTQSTQIIASLAKWEEVQKAIYLSAYSSADLPVPNARYDMHITGDTSSGISPKGEWVALTIEPDSFLKSLPWLVDAPIQTAPKTLSEFRRWWNTLHSGVSAQVVILPKNDRTCTAKIVPTHLLDAQRQPKKYDLNCEISQGSDTGIVYYALDIDWSMSETESEHLAFATGHAEFDILHAPTGPKRMKNPRRVTVTKSFEYREARTDESGLKKLYSDWRTGPYENAFRELAAVSNDIENIEISAVPGRIQSMQAVSERDVEIFGLKMPAARIAVPGTLLLLAAQLYFWLHLHELNAKSTPSSAGRDVAWIGAYRSAVARISTITSACILPSIAAAIAAYKILIGARPAAYVWMFWSATTLACLGLATATGISLRRLQASWQNAGYGTDES
jgi:hypothetical protein